MMRGSLFVAAIRRASRQVLALIACAMLGMWAFVPASPAAAQGATIGPVPPKAQGACVADKETMRRTHMTMLKHQRDMTVHEGVRGKPEGLTNCITCHAVKDEAGKFVSYHSPKHFCRSCHDYAAVSVDCFECHTSRPAAKENAALDGAGKADLAMAEKYLAAHGGGNQGGRP